MDMKTRFRISGVNVSFYFVAPDCVKIAISQHDIVNWTLCFSWSRYCDSYLAPYGNHWLRFIKTGRVNCANLYIILGKAFVVRTYFNNDSSPTIPIGWILLLSFNYFSWDFYLYLHCSTAQLSHSHLNRKTGLPSSNEAKFSIVLNV